MEVVPASADWLNTGVNLFAARPDQTWSLTDCISFSVMTQRNLTDALTADRHFEQAGFRAASLSARRNRYAWLMTMGPEPISRIFFRSVRRGMCFRPFDNGCLFCAVLSIILWEACASSKRRGHTDPSKVGRGNCGTPDLFSKRMDPCSDAR